MTRFSDKYNFRPPRDVLQTDSLDDDTRTGIWNALYMLFQGADSEYTRTRMRSLQVWWAELLNKDLDKYPDYDEGARDWVKATVKRGVWFEVLDTVEMLCQLTPEMDHGRPAESFQRGPNLFNQVFEKYQVQYRFVDGEIAPVTDEAQVAAIEDAIEHAPLDRARANLRDALALVSNRREPNYAKSIAESISAVESVARAYTGKSTLSPAVDALERSGVRIHTKLRDAWKTLYNWTSDDGGVRHGDHREVITEPDEALAMYFLVVCSGIVSYLTKEAAKNGIEVLASETETQEAV